MSSNERSNKKQSGTNIFLFSLFFLFFFFVVFFFFLDITRAAHEKPAKNMRLPAGRARA